MTGSRFMLSQLDLFTQFIKVFSKAEDEISFVISLILDFIIQMSYLTVDENFCESYSNEKLITKQTKAPLMMSVSYAMTRIHAFIFARLLDVS